MTDKTTPTSLKLPREAADQSVGNPCPMCHAGTLQIVPNTMGYGDMLACTNLGAGCQLKVAIAGKPRGKSFTAIHNPRRTSVMPSPSGIAPQAVATSSVTIGTFEFPYKESSDVVIATRQSLASGATGLTFGPRKREMWIEVAARLFQCGLVTNAKEAVALGYHLAVVGREIEANRKFAIELYTNKFGHEFDVNVPTIPYQTIVEFFVEVGLPLYVTGLPGVGKTYAMVEAVRAKYGLNPVRQQNGGESTMADVLGAMGFKDNATTWQDGTLSYAARNGIPYLCDEMDKARDDVQSAYVALLESHDGTITLPTGEKLVPKPGFCFLANGNTVGLGEGLQFEGTRIINEAIRDRMYFLTADYPTPATELAWNTSRLAKLGLQVTLTGGAA